MCNVFYYRTIKDLSGNISLKFRSMGSTIECYTAVSASVLLLPYKMQLKIRLNANKEYDDVDDDDLSKFPMNLKIQI